MRKIYLLVAINFLALSFAWGQSFSVLSGPPGGYVSDIERTSGGTLYAVVSNTLYQSTDNGGTWQKTTITTPANGIFFEDLIIGPNGKFYGLTYSELYTSTDATNWTRVSTTSFYGVYKIKRFGPDGFLSISGWNGVWVSKDDGITFTQILTENVYDEYKVTANSAGDMFVGTSSGIKRYLYPGASGTFDPANWAIVYPITNAYHINLGVDGSNNIYVSTANNTNGNYFRFVGRSTAANNGNVGTWIGFPQTSISTTDWYGFWALNSISNTFYYFNRGDGGKIYSSNNLSTSNYTLTGTTTNNSSYIVVASTASATIGDAVTGTGIPDGSFITNIASATDLYINNNCTATGAGVTITATKLTNPWTVTNSPSRAYGSSDRNVVFASATNYFVGSDASAVFKTSDNGSTFTLSSNGINSGNGNDVAVSNTGRIIYINNYSTSGYWTSTNGGSTWTFVSLNRYVRKVIKLKDGTILLYGDRVYRSTDDGANFTEILSTGYVTDLEVDPNNTTTLNTNVVYYIDGSTLYKSTDSGLTWNSVTIPDASPPRPPNSYINYMTVNAAGDIYFLSNFYDSNTSTTDFSLYKMSGGTTTLIPNKPWSNEVYLSPNNLFILNNKLYVCSYNVLYTTGDDGTSWGTNGFSGSFVFPVTQGGFNGIAVSRNGTLYISQTDGKTFVSNTLPSTNATISNMVLDNSGNFIASAQNSAALKFTGTLLVDPATIPAPIDFGWVATNGPYGGPTENLLKDNNNKVYTYSWRGYYKADIAVTSWTTLNYPPQNSYFNDIALNKSTGKLYSIVWDRIFSSVDGGTSWSEVINSENIVGRQRVTVSSNGNIVMLVDNKKIYTSTDGGTTFGAPKLTLASDEYYYGDKLVSSSNNAIYLKLYKDNTGYFAMKSLDGGLTWSNMTFPPNQTDLWNLSTDNAGSVYFVNCCNMFKSSDNGSTWTSIKGDINNGWRYVSKVSVGPDDAMYFPANDGNLIALKKSTNGGTSWTNVGYMGDVDVFDVDWVGTKIVAATFFGAIASTDNGATFTDISTGITNVIDGNLLVGSSTRLDVASADYSFKTENSGASWSRTTPRLRTFFDHPGGYTVAVGVDRTKAYKSTDGGTTWTPYFTYNNGGIEKYFTADGTSHYIMTYNEIYYSNDLITWTKLSISGMPPFDKRNFRDVSADTNGLIYCIVYNYISQKDEAYQILFGSGILLNQVQYPQNLFFKQGKTYLFGQEGTLASTTNGTTWTKKAAPNGYKFSIEARDYFFVYQWGGILWLSRDLGQSWQNVGLGTNTLDFRDVALNELDGYAYATFNSRSPVRKSDKIIIPDDGTKPLLTSFTPANNATGVSIKPQLTITFDEGVIPQATKTIRVLDVNNVNIAVETILVTDGVQSGKSFTFTLTNFLNFNTQYFVVIDAGAYKDIFGNTFDGLLSNTAWRFTTKATPTVASTIPANNATGVAIDTKFTITFSESISGAASKNVYLYETAAASSPAATISVTTPASQFVSILPVGGAASQSVTLTFDATKGGKELMGAAKVYAYAGVVTSNATGTDWSFVKGNWGQDDGVGQMTAVPGDPDKWRITFGPSLREYFNVPAATNIYRIAIVFRNASGNVKASPPPGTVPTGHFVANNGDYYVDLAQTAPACVGTVVKEGSKLVITGCANLKYQTQYFIKFDPLALLSSEGQSISLVTLNTDWTFTTVPPPDTQKPVITYTPLTTPDSYAQGSGNRTISVTISDGTGSGVPTDSAKIYYRSITSSATFTKTSLTLNGNKYDVSLSEPAFGKMGLEFYFTARDAAGNLARSPETGNRFIMVAGPADGITFPSGLLGSGGELAGWKIITIPNLPSNNSLISSVFGELGDANNTLWRMIRYKDNNSDWAQYPGDFTAFKQGEGYFINIKDPPTIKIEGAIAPSNNKTTLFQLTLKPGWNQIGNPYTFPMKWSEALAFNTGISTDNIKTIKAFSGGSYVAKDQIDAYEGAFVLNNGTQLTIQIPIVTSLSGGRTSSDNEPEPKLNLFDIGKDEWMVPIAIKSGEVENLFGGVGMRNGATLTVDQYDDFNAPPIADYIEMSFPHPEHFIKKSTREVVPVQDEHTWEFAIDTNLDGPIELKWDNTRFGENTKDLFLFDVANGTLVDMRKQNVYVTARGKSGLFEIHFGENLSAKIKPKSVFLGEAYPNPGNGDISIPFTLPENQTSIKVGLDVFDQLGRKISTLVDQSLSSGFYTSIWESNRSNLNDGVYVYRLTVVNGGRVEHYTKRIILKN